MDSLEDLGKRLTALEARLAAVEARLAGVEGRGLPMDIATLPRCPVCGSSGNVPCMNVACPFATHVTCQSARKALP